MQAPRLIHRRNRRYPIMVVLLLSMAGLWMGFPILTGTFRAMSSSAKFFPSTDSQQPAPEPAKQEEEPVDQAKAAQEEAFEKQSVNEDAKVNYLDASLEDPLSSFMVGYPTAAFSVADLKLCDAEQTIILQGSYTCPDDVSCLKCVNRHQQERYHEVRNAFRNPAIQDARRAYVKEQFAGQHTIVIFTFNFAHSDLFLNWACSVQKLGMDVKAFTLVIPCDEKSTELAKSLGFKYVDPAWQKLLHKPIRSSESFWGQDHADINNLALYTMVDLVELGFHVFVHDADVAWIRDPFPFFKKSIRRRDFMAMLAPFWNSMGPVNTGLLYLAPTRQLKIFLQSMENAAIVKGTSDQKLWNTILRHFAFQQLEWRLLPQAVVYKYSGRHAPPPDERALLIHALGTGKREKLARHKLWLLEPSCIFYNAESAALSEKEIAKFKAGK